MTIGIGGFRADEELAKLSNMTHDVSAIEVSEYGKRISHAQKLMQENGFDAIYINAGSSLYYFTGASWYPSERMVGAIIPAQGEIEYILPAFEKGTFAELALMPGHFNCWEEHQAPALLFKEILVRLNLAKGMVGLDEVTPFFIANNIAQVIPSLQIKNAQQIISGCRMFKSTAELALMQRANDMTLAVHKAAARILYAGMTTREVESFIHAAHKKVGAPNGSSFCIVLFGPDTAFPHGVKSPKALSQNDVVLIDTGCKLQNYCSDITRTYVFGEPSKRQQVVWDHEKEAQAKAFAAAQLGKPCSDVDKAAREYLEEVGYGPEYSLPGLPHRTGHGTGLDIHEWPYLVKDNPTPLAIGMCCSNEPMICIPGEFGIRHEDHFYLTEAGPKWFTQPALSIFDPFGYEK